MKESLKTIFNLFVYIYTAVSIGAVIDIYIFYGDISVVDGKIIMQIMMVSALSAISGGLLIPSFSGKELSRKALIMRRIGYFLLVNVIVMVSGALFDWYDPRKWQMVLGLECVIIFVFALVTMIFYLMDSKTAEKLNEKLQERMKK